MKTLCLLTLVKPMIVQVQNKLLFAMLVQTKLAVDPGSPMLQCMTVKECYAALIDYIQGCCGQTPLQ